MTDEIDVNQAPRVTDAVSADAFVRWCVRVIGAGFHPDSPFADYVEGGSGLPTFTPAEAGSLDARMRVAFGLLDDPSEVALDEAREPAPFPHPADG